MVIETTKVNSLLDYLDAYDIIPDKAKSELARMIDTNFVFREQLGAAESVHLHIKVPSTAMLPHHELLKCGGIPQNEKEGYIKYAFPNGVNLIFSSIPVSQEEKAGLVLYNYPHLDHIGIDIRKDDDESHAVFNSIPSLAERHSLPVKKQGGEGKNVYCCHVQVNEKYWVYPVGHPHFEFAFGPLVVNEHMFGCDLRPADPSLLVAEEKQPCCSGNPATHSSNC